LNPNAFYVIGLMIDHADIKCGMFSNGMTLLGQVTVSIDTQKGNLHLLRSMGRAVSAVIAESGIAQKKLKALGVIAPGYVNVDQGTFEEPDGLPNCRAVPVKQYLERECKVPVSVGRNVLAMAVAEKYYGCSSSAQNMCYIHVGQGIAASFILDGVLYRGSLDLAGEIGHVPLLLRGPKCKCGNHACLEVLASTIAITKNYRERVKKLECQFDDVVTAAREGDVDARMVLNKAAKYIGIAVGNIFNLLDLDLVIIGGALVGAQDMITDIIIKTAHGRMLPPQHERNNIMFGKLGNRTGITSAALLGIESVYNRYGIKHI